ncbi:MAG: hypothetical protein HYT16_02035 [DPANN group archaeon]|nr:hypothetical protein [DPANN group archaeon]
MEFTILEENKGAIKIEASARDEGFFNLVKRQLWQNGGVEIASFRIAHPDISRPVFVIKAKSGKDPKKLWNAALESISEELKSFEKEIKKLK